MLACTETSSADRISSQSSSDGSATRRAGDGDALALAARELVGEALRISGVEPDVRRAPRRRRWRPLLVRPKNNSSGRASVLPTRARGLSEASGFWKTILDQPALFGAALADQRPASALPRTARCVPSAGAIRPRWRARRVDLPLPDSPTRAKVSPCLMSKRGSARRRRRRLKTHAEPLACRP